LVERRKADVENRGRPEVADGGRKAAAGRPRGFAALANNFADIMQGGPWGCSSDRCSGLTEIGKIATLLP